MGDTSIEEFIVGLAVEACAQGFARIAHAASVRRGHPLAVQDAKDSIRGARAADQLSLVTLLGADSAETAVELQRFLSRPALRSVASQIYAGALLGELEAVRPRAIRLTSQLYLREFPDAVAKTAEAASISVVDLLIVETEAQVLELKDSVRSEEELLELANSTLARATLDSCESMLETLTRATSVGVTRLALEDWAAKYRKLCAAAHGSIIPPDFRERTPVPIKSLYVAPDLESPSHAEGSRTVLDLIGNIDRDVLLGDPGGGKSTASQVIAHTLAEQVDGLVPFIVVLRDYAIGRKTTSVVEFIEEQIKAFYNCPLLGGAVESLLSQGEGLVIFDGLDELLNTADRVDVTTRVEAFSRAFPNAPVLVTSRKVGYAEARLNTSMFRQHTIAGFNEKNVAAYVDKWFNLQPREVIDSPATFASSFLKESESVPDLRRNPLMLSLMCIIYRGQQYLPRNRTGVYEACSRLLFETWDRSRKINVGLDFEAHLDAALKHLAYWMLVNDSLQDGVLESALVDEATAFFVERAYDTDREAREAAEAFITFCRGRAWVLSEAGTTKDGEARFTFTHRTFMEYFAAYHLTRQYPDPIKLANQLFPHVRAEEWDVIGQLAVHILNGAVDRGGERLLRRLMEASVNSGGERRELVLGFVVRAMEYLAVPPALVREVIVACADSIAAGLATTKKNPSSHYGSAWRTLAASEGLGAEIQQDINATIRDRWLSGQDQAKAAALYMLLELSTWELERGKRQDFFDRWQRMVEVFFAEYLDEAVNFATRYSPWTLQLILFRELIDLTTYLERMSIAGEPALSPLYRSPVNPLNGAGQLYDVATFIEVNCMGRSPLARGTAIKLATDLSVSVRLDGPTLTSASSNYERFSQPVSVLQKPASTIKDVNALSSILLFCCIRVEALKDGKERPVQLAAALRVRDVDVILKKVTPECRLLVESWLASGANFIGE